MYDIHSYISTIAEVENFAKFLFNEKHLAFHPDEDFAEYISNETHEPLFTENDVELYNRLMNECFVVCENANEDIYEVMCKYHPLLAE